jgi:hypothetical protein
MDADYRRLWDTGAFSDLSNHNHGLPVSERVIGKLVTYTAHER